jgi:hypothetical protein
MHAELFLYVYVSGSVPEDGRTAEICGTYLEN